MGRGSSFDFEDEDWDLDELETFSQYTVRRAEKRQKRHAEKEKIREKLQQPLEDTVIPQKYFWPLKFLQFVINAFLIFFAITACLGGFLQLHDSIFSSKDSDSSGSQDEEEVIDWRLAKDAAIIAFFTTWEAVKLWSRLLWSILVPTSQRTFMITKEGFIAMQPSLLVSWKFIQELPPTVKLAATGGALLIVASVAMLQEAKTRRLIDKIVNGTYLVGDYFSYKYHSFSIRVSKRSRIVAEFLPHLLFLIAAGAAVVAAPSLVSDFAKGIGGWAVVIGLPVTLSVRALVVYDQCYNARIMHVMLRNRRQSKRRMSILPQPDERGRQSRAGSFFNGLMSAVKKPFAQEDATDQDSSDDSESEMRPYLTLRNKKNYRTARGVQPLEYPRVLDTDDQSAVEQAAELEELTIWLKYWLVLAFALVLEQLPITGHFLAVFPVWPSARMLFAIWLMAPGLKGADIAFFYALPLFNKYWKKIELPGAKSGRMNLVGQVLLNSLPVGDKARNYLSAIGETDGSLLLTAIPFFFLPSFLTSVGCVLIGLAMPMYTGFVTVLSVEAAAFQAKMSLIKKTDGPMTKLKSREKKILKHFGNTDQENAITVASSALHCRSWLEYWVVYAVVMLGVGLLSIAIGWMPLWNQIQLGILLWLQLPYFRGARRVLKILLTSFYNFRKKFFPKDDPNEFALENLGRTAKRKTKKRVRLGRFDGDKNGGEARNLNNMSFLEDDNEQSGFEKALREEELAAPPSPSRSEVGDCNQDDKSSEISSP